MGIFTEIEKYKEIWERERSVTITDLFSDHEPIELWNFYKNNSSFKPCFFTGDADENGEVPLVYADKGTEEYKLLTSRIGEMVNRNEFTYRFSRTHEIPQALIDMWRSKLFLGAIEYITGYSDLEWWRDSTFTSKYEEGDFLSPHTDIHHGRVAFVYQLTKDWVVCKGGLFLRMSDWINVDKTVVPQFNQLTLFDVAGEGVPHMVTQVSHGVKDARMGYSGWFK